MFELLIFTKSSRIVLNEFWEYGMDLLETPECDGGTDRIAVAIACSNRVRCTPKIG